MRTPLLLCLALVLASPLSLMAANESTAQTKHVAMVFDDGPFPAHAPKFRELFAAEDVKVTWAYVAREVKLHPDTAKAALAAGHEIANHSFNHLQPREQDDTTLRHEVVASQELVTAETGIAPRWYWKPFLANDPRHAGLLAEAGLGDFSHVPVVSSNDWNREAADAEDIFRNATTGVQDGCIILFHEWREETLAQMPAIIAELKRQGCEFMTFSQLAEYLEARAAATE